MGGRSFCEAIRCLHEELISFAGSAVVFLRRLAELPLAFQPGEGWRYHHSFGVLGILISRVTGRPPAEHLAEDVFWPLGMTDTALWVPEGKLDRLPGLPAP